MLPQLLLLLVLHGQQGPAAAMMLHLHLLSAARPQGMCFMAIQLHGSVWVCLQALWRTCCVLSDNNKHPGSPGRQVCALKAQM
jgi:hypothetical protein